jgi:hypothetical protein
MTKLPIVALTTAILLASLPGAWGQQAPTKDKVVGTWKLLSFFDQNIDTGKTTNVLGENPRGQMILNADGQIALVNVSGSRKSPQGSVATDAEAAHLYRQVIAYIGHYEIDPTPTEAGLGMTITNDLGTNPLTEGVGRKFSFSLDGNKLIFKTAPPARNPVTGEITTRNVVWERGP